MLSRSALRAVARTLSVPPQAARVTGWRAASTAAVPESTMGSDAVTYRAVEEYYGKVLSSTKDLKTSACTASGPPPPQLTAAINAVPQGVTDKFYGCGTPLPLGVEGLSMLDLGSGSGRDAYVAAGLVGPEGSVVGVDMTDEQLATAREHVDVRYFFSLARCARISTFAHSAIGGCAHLCLHSHRAGVCGNVGIQTELDICEGQHRVLEGGVMQLGCSMPS